MNDKNKLYLKKCLSENNISHAFLVETDNYDEFICDVFKIFKEYNKIFNSSSIDNNICIRTVVAENNLIEKVSIVELQNFISTTSFDDYYKLYFIIGADAMNQSAANKLLKTLEEPVTKSVGFLLCSDRNTVLPTLISRCQILVENNVLMNYDIDDILIDKLSNFKLFNFDEYIEFKIDLLKKDKNEIFLIFDNFLSVLYKNNDIFYIKVAIFLENIKKNANIDIQLDKLYFERLL